MSLNVPKTFAVGLVCGVLLTGLGVAIFHKQYQHKKETDELTARLKPYFQLLDQNPKVLGPMGDASKGEIEIIRGIDKIAEIERNTKQKVGILAETPWQVWINDAVKFPNGTYGTYTRIFWKQAFKGAPGAVVLPILSDGRILVQRIYRHPLRKWTYEVPRGVGSGRETIRAIAKRELGEETGAETSSETTLGKVNADSGLTSGGIGVVEARVSKFGKTNRDAAETSINTFALTEDQMEKAITEGIDVKIAGNIEHVKIEDSFTIAAFSLHRLKQTEKQ